MLKFIIILLLIIIAIIALCIIGNAFLKMPFVFEFKNKKTGIFSERWLDWLQDNKHELIYNYVVPRKIRQDRYAHTHVAHYRIVTNDCYYDTDSAEHFWTRYTKLSKGDPCAMHYFKTKNGEFFCMTSSLGMKDSFSVIPEREMKKLLKNEPSLYLKYIPNADKNEDLKDLKRKTEENEQKKVAEKNVKSADETNADMYSAEIEALEKALSDRKKALKDAKRRAKEAEKGKKSPSKKGFHININIGFDKPEPDDDSVLSQDNNDKEEPTVLKQPADKSEQLSEKDIPDDDIVMDNPDSMPPEKMSESKETLKTESPAADSSEESVPDSADTDKKDTSESSDNAKEMPSPPKDQEKKPHPHKESKKMEVMDDFGDEISLMTNNSVTEPDENDKKKEMPAQKQQPKQSAKDKENADKKAAENASDKNNQEAAHTVVVPTIKRPSTNTEVNKPIDTATEKETPKATGTPRTQENKTKNSDSTNTDPDNGNTTDVAQPADNVPQGAQQKESNPESDKPSTPATAPSAEKPKRVRRKITMQAPPAQDESEMDFNNAENFNQAAEEASDDIEAPDIPEPSVDEIRKENEKEEHDEAIANLDNIAQGMPGIPRRD